MMSPEARRYAKKLCERKNNPFMNIPAQAIEMLEGVNRSIKLLSGLKLAEEAPAECPVKTCKCSGVAACEAPRGTLFHSYSFDKKGYCTSAEITTPTTQNLKNLERMGVQNVGNAMRLTVKVDDTVSGAGEGAPLCWSVAVSRWGNYVVDSRAQAETLAPDDLRQRELAAKEMLVRESAAHYVIDDLRGLPAVLEDINARLTAGETPWLKIF